MSLKKDKKTKNEHFLTYVNGNTILYFKVYKSPLKVWQKNHESYIWCN